jgi:hypothetical protein
VRRSSEEIREFEELRETEHREIREFREKALSLISFCPSDVI